MSGSAHIRFDVVDGSVLVCFPERRQPRRITAPAVSLSSRLLAEFAVLIDGTAVLEVVPQLRTPAVTAAINRLVRIADEVDPLPAPRPRIPGLHNARACRAPGVLQRPKSNTYVYWDSKKYRYRVDVTGPAHPKVPVRGVLRKWRLGSYSTLEAAKAARDAALSEVRRHWHPHMSLDDYITLRDRAIDCGRSAGKNHTQETYNAQT